jgi:hypothetical protein
MRKLGERRMDMRFKGVRGEEECVPKSIKLMRWGVIGEGAEAEIDTGQGDVGLIEERWETKVKTENRHGGEGYSESVGKGFIEDFL